MFPTQHDAVSDLLEEEGIFFTFHTDDDSRCEKEYDTNIMGRFLCHNNACSARGWSSKVVAITIRMYPGSEYNARVYHQRCKACNKLSKPKLDESYAERVAYRLKKWRGVEMEIPHHYGPSKAPHESSLCEGCKHGHCKG
jgi:Zinc-binding domain